MVLYVDPQSPYAYLAEARAADVLGSEPELQPIALGAIFVRRGWGSWAFMETRAENITAIEERAAAAGLPALTWPADWPAQTLAPARATAWAHERGAVRPFLHAYWSQVFAHGTGAGEASTLASAATAAGLDADALATGITEPALKDTLREWTDAAWDAGVRGVPTLSVDGELFYGDDQLEAARR